MQFIAYFKPEILHIEGGCESMMTKKEERAENIILWKQRDVLYSYTKAQWQFLYTVEQYVPCTTRKMLIFPKHCIYFKIDFSSPVVKKLKSVEKRNSHIPAPMN